MLVAGVAIGWIHIMAVVVVLGGSFFINTVLAGAAKELPPPEAGKLNQAIGKGFGPVAMIASVLILITGVVRAAAMGLLSPSVLLSTQYGNLLSAKIVLFGAIIVNMVLIASTGAMMAGLAAADGAPDEDAMNAGAKRIKTLGATNFILGAIVVAFSVAMRFIGAPEL